MVQQLRGAASNESCGTVRRMKQQMRKGEVVVQSMKQSSTVTTAFDKIRTMNLDDRKYNQTVRSDEQHTEYRVRPRIQDEPSIIATAVCQ